MNNVFGIPSARGLEFVLGGFDFVPPRFDFLPVGFDFLHGALEIIHGPAPIVAKRRLDYPSVAKSAQCGRIRLPNTA